MIFDHLLQNLAFLNCSAFDFAFATAFFSVAAGSV